MTRGLPRQRLLKFAVPGAVAGNVAGVVFDRTRRERDWLALGIGVSVAVYGALGLWAESMPARRSSPPPRRFETSVELLAPPPRPAPQVLPQRSISAPRAAHRAETVSALPVSAPAAAAPVIAREPAPHDEPVDMTSFSIAAGQGARFSGGQTSATGTSTSAVTGPAGVPAGGAPASVGDLSRPVSISETEWSDCAWPPEADTLGIDEQVVSMRAVAAADGRFESAQVLSDPGHGFGAALLACARRHGFTPALDRAGRPVRAVSGVLRFTFTR